MRRTILFGICLVGLCSDRSLLGDEPEIDVDGKVTSVALFKNGIAIVRREVPIQTAGTYRLRNVPDPIHGTFVVESIGAIEARVEPRPTNAKQPSPLGTNLQKEMAGLKVTLFLRNEKSPVVVGTVASLPSTVPTMPDTSLTPTATPYPHWGWAPMSSPMSSPTSVSRFLILTTDKGQTWVDLNDIASIQAEGNPIPDTPSTLKPVLLLRADEASAGKTARISYLSHGLAWAPNYHVQLLDDNRMSLEQIATIRNELGDLAEAEVSVITGFPNIPYSSVLSPMAASQNWSNFLQSLNSIANRDKWSNNALSNSVMTQQVQVGGPNALSRAEADSAAALGDTIDLHYHSIGKRSITQGGSISVSTGKSQSNYQRIVDWSIPDTRNEFGHPVNAGNERRIDPLTGAVIQDDLWDALVFKNTLPFPMTSAPGMVSTQGNFSGQGLVTWTNRNDECTLRVNKALSIRAQHFEYEDQVGDKGKSGREIVYVGHSRYQKVLVNGELKISNQRAAKVKMIVKRQFSGDLIKADGSPKVNLREEGVWSVNKRNELTWTLDLKPSEERTVPFQYAVLSYFPG